MKKIKYQCIKCKMVFEAVPGPIQCPFCSHNYVQMIHGCRGPTPCETPLACAKECKYDNDPIHPNRIS